MKLKRRGARSLPLDGPEWHGVEAFLPGHVLSRADEGRLLDLYDLVHFAKAQRDRAVSVSQLARIHPIKPTKEGRDGGGVYKNYHNVIARLLAFGRTLGIDMSTVTASRGDSTALSNRVRSILRGKTARKGDPEVLQTRIKFKNPWHACARVNHLLDALSAGSDEDDDEAEEEANHAHHEGEVAHSHEA